MGCTSTGVLYQRRPGAFLGVFDTEEAARSAIACAGLQPVKEEPVTSMGRASC